MRFLVSLQLLILLTGLSTKIKAQSDETDKVQFLKDIYHCNVSSSYQISTNGIDLNYQAKWVEHDNLKLGDILTVLPMIIKAFSNFEKEISGSPLTLTIMSKCSSYKKLDIVKQLISNGADPNYSVKGYTPIGIALRWKEPNIADFLVESGANPLAPSIDIYGTTNYLNKLIEENKYHNVTSLRDKGVSFARQPNITYSPLEVAAAHGDFQMINLVLELSPSNLSDEKNERNLFPNLATNKKLQELSFSDFYLVDTLLQKLIQRGVGLNSKSLKYGRTGLFESIYHENYAMAEALLKYKASPNIADVHDRYPLQIAVGNRNVSLVKLLLKYKASINIQNYNGDTPLHLAIKNKDTTMAKLLTSFGASLTTKNHYNETPLDLIHKLDIISAVEFSLSINGKISDTDYSLYGLEQSNNDILAKQQLEGKNIYSTVVRKKAFENYCYLLESNKPVPGGMNWYINNALEKIHPFSATTSGKIKWGYKLNDKEIINAQFDEVKPFNYAGIAFVKKGTKWGVINLNGELIQWMDYENNKKINYRFDKPGITDLQEKQFIYVQSNKKHGVIDALGNEIITCGYDSVQIKSDPLLLFAKNEEGWHIYNKEGDEIAPPQNKLIEYNWKGLPIALITNRQQFGLLAKDGEQIIPAEFDEIEILLEHLAIKDKYIFKVRKDGKWKLWEYGATAIKGNYYDKIEYLPTDNSISWTSSKFLFKVYTNGKAGLINELGEELVAPKFDNILPIHDSGLYGSPWVSIKESGKWKFYSRELKDLNITPCDTFYYAHKDLILLKNNNYLQVQIPGNRYTRNEKYEDFIIFKDSPQSRSFPAIALKSDGRWDIYDSNGFIKEYDLKAKNIEGYLTINEKKYLKIYKTDKKILYMNEKGNISKINKL